MMRRVEGPECPKCGCRDSELVRAYTFFGTKRERRQCSHCLKQFTAKVQDEDEVDEEEEAPEPDLPKDTVPFKGIACPYCRSMQTRITHTKRPLRRHICDDCGRRFKSQEN